MIANDSSTIPFITNRFVPRQRCDKIAHPVIDLAFTGLIIRTVIAVIIIAAVLWLVFKLGKLADAYNEKLRTK
jgi:hypothetical protein